MSRYDKYDNISGGFRAPLDDDQDKITGNPIGYGLDVDGHAVPGAGVTGVLGVVCATRNMVAGDIIDIMTAGEVVEFEGDPGTVYYADATDGELSDTPSDFPVGYTVESTRLIVRMGAASAGAVETALGLDVPQPNIAAIATADGSDPATTQALANATKAKVNAVIAALVAAGILAP